MNDFGWKRVAVKLARSGVGFYMLTTIERDALLKAMEEARAIDRDKLAEVTADAADRGADA